MNPQNEIASSRTRIPSFIVKKRVDRMTFPIHGHKFQSHESHDSCTVKTRVKNDELSLTVAINYKSIGILLHFERIIFS